MRQGPQKALTGSALDSRVAQFGQRSMIRSIQRGSIAIASGSTSNTATISTVDLNNTIVSLVGTQSDSTADNWSRVMLRLALTNATTLTATRSASNEIQTLTYEVIEFMPGVIKQVQRGTVSMAHTVNFATSTITTVNTAKAMLTSLGLEQDNLSICSSIVARLTLTNATTVTVNRATGNLNMTMGYQVVEFY